jgi:hypothetical protein
VGAGAQLEPASYESDGLGCAVDDKSAADHAGRGTYIDDRDPARSYAALPYCT